MLKISNQKIVRHEYLKTSKNCQSSGDLWYCVSKYQYDAVRHYFIFASLFRSGLVCGKYILCIDLL